MPRGDRTGPTGVGPMTGRGAGFCTGNAAPGYMNPTPGRGMGFGRGQGRGFGRGMGWKHGWGFQGMSFAAPPAPAARIDELSALKSQADYFGEALKSINSRISELESEKK